ncbi:nucleolar protein 9 [Harpegnathos saltator]|uniref:Pumilio domain-containing protein C14orf21 n=1 Tax=Harpegnathos saltator TaxID=610380 RepID=E2BTB4_HARSA|nr:nucleolar protein 9 [Harpegnathos saltator]EFN81116.1 Pumilio domain-containing protein C14orf21 [Harpegnathos saltator]
MESHNVIGKKRKKKRSHMQMAKKFARQRYSGNELDKDTYQYLIRVLELMREGFPTSEEKMIYVQNVYQETVGHEIEYAQNQVGSRVMDSLLKYANLETIERLIKAFMSSVRKLSSDRFASHVLQKIIMICADRGNRISDTSTTDKTATSKTSTETEDNTADVVVQVKYSEKVKYNDIVLQLSKYYINNMEEFVFDTYANHILRTVIECLAGLIEDADSEGNKKSMPCLTKRRPVIQEYRDLLVQSCDRLQKWPQFLEFGQDEVTSGLVQCVLYSLNDIDLDLTSTIIKKISTQCFKSEEDGKLSNIFNAECSIRLLETCLIVATPKSFKKLYKMFFVGNLKHLCLTQITNFSVQKLLDYCTTKEEMEAIFDEVSEHFPEILKRGFTGILASAGNACLRLQTKQGAFVNAIIKLLECGTSTQDPMQLVPCTVILKSPTQLKSLPNDQQPPFSLHGSLIIQAMLHFNKPIKIVNSLLEMNNEELLRLFGDPKGSRILDAFMDSKYIGEKSREKLFKKLRGTWAELAKSTHGSRCLDKMWVWARPDHKISIMEELSAAGESLRSSKSGRIIYTKLNLPLFQRSKKDWSESQGKEEKIRALFANVIKNAPGK